MIPNMMLQFIEDYIYLVTETGHGLKLEKVGPAKILVKFVWHLQNSASAFCVI